ncbi:MAG: ShlB/FhaC/HecB family hemolysin secretion/activation protein [Planctomycetota bacterium]|jgi:hemolysin activation/secretion protein
MDLSKQLKALVTISLFCLITAAFASEESNIRREQLETELSQPQSVTESVAASDQITFPEDTSRRFSVKELKISGNTLISTEALLEKLPEAYIVSAKLLDDIDKEIYDFRVVIDLIRHPGADRKVSLKTIQGLTKYILSVYQNTGYAGIYVYVPADAAEDDKLADDILPIQILEGRIAQVSIERYDFDRNRKEKGYLKGSLLESWSPLEEGDVINKKKLDNFVRLLNLNPDRFISPVISRSSEPNALNLSYDVYETSPWHFYAQVDNSGTEDRQWSPKVGLVNTNLTGMDDRFSVMYQAPLEKGIEEKYTILGGYEFPVFIPRLRLNLYAGYNRFDVPQAGIDFIGNGSFYGGVLRYNLLQIDNWFLDVTGSLSDERSKVTPSLGIASDVDMELLGVGVNLHRSDDMSDTSLSFNRSENIGGSGKSDFENARLDTDPDFTIYTYGAAHRQYLDIAKVNRINASFRLITSNERLIPAKMTTFGGFYSVRGYKEAEIVADGGILISGQYEYDLVKAGEASSEIQESPEMKEAAKPLLKKLAPVAFIDSGRAKIKNPIAGEVGVRELWSVGTGLIIETWNDFSAKMYYGWALRGTEQTDRGDGRLHLSFMLRF